MRFPMIGKGLALGAVMLGLLWALATVSGVVAERQVARTARRSNRRRPSR